jgi:predicted dehydrogenase
MQQNRREFLAGAAALTISTALAGKAASAEGGKKYRACIIGDWDNGAYGHSLHLAFLKRPDVEVVALADPHEKARAKFAKECGAAKTYADYKEMLKTEKPDLVSIGPRFTVRHKEYLLAAAEVGAHGYMEKPIAPDLAEADAMVQAIEAKNLKWAVAHQKRMTPLIAHLKKLVFQDGLIGDVLEMRGRGKEDKRAGGEDLLVLGTHLMDLMEYFAGKPKRVVADITVEGRPATKADVHEASEPLGLVVGDRIQVAYAFDNGLKGYFSTMKNADGDGGRWGLDLYGSKGIVTIRMAEDPIVYLLREPSWAPGGKETQWEPLPDAPAALPTDNKDLLNTMNGYAVDDLIAAISENREPGVSLQKARDALEMILAAYESYIHKGPVELPLKERTHPLTRWNS